MSQETKEVNDDDGMSFGVPEALDIIEGTASGGIASFTAYLVGGAVAQLPGSFLQASSVTPLAVVVGALTFLGVAIAKIRKRNKNLQ